MGSEGDGAKTALIAVGFLAAGASLGALMSVLMTQRRRRRYERAFTTEDTTALAFHIAKLSQQLAKEQNSSSVTLESQLPVSPRVQYPAEDRKSKLPETMVTMVEDNSEDNEHAEHVSDAGASASSSSEIQKVAESSTEGSSSLRTRRSFVDQAKEVLKRDEEKNRFRRNDDVDTFADVLAMYRAQYQSWRKGNHKGAKTRDERLLTARSRSYSQTEATPDLQIPGHVDKRDRLSTYLWQKLNLGPSNTSQKPVKVAVIGGGAFGTSMAAVAARNGHYVTIVSRRREQARDIKLTRRNDQYLPGLELPENVSATVDLAEAMKGVELIIHALPAQKTPDWIIANKHLIPENVIFLSTSKGLHLESKSLLSTAMAKAFGRPQPLAVLSGPSFAKEIVTEQPTSVVVASKTLADAVKVQRLMSSTTFRVYASQDTVGVELGGALKNPLAIGAGMIEGLGFGINTMSAYVTRSCAELTSLAIAMGGKPETVAGLSGIGDLMLTAFGNLSRNRSCGIRMVKGETLDEILSTTTVEGVPTAKVAVAFAEQCNLHLPIFETVNQILSGKLRPEDFVVTAMMTRPLSMETHVSPLSEVHG